MQLFSGLVHMISSKWSKLEVKGPSRKKYKKSARNTKTAGENPIYCRKKSKNFRKKFKKIRKKSKQIRKKYEISGRNEKKTFWKNECLTVKPVIVYTKAFRLVIGSMWQSVERYCAERTHHVLYFWKAGALRISNIILKGMSGASSGACLGQHLGHIVNNGQQSEVPHASVMPLFCHQWISNSSFCFRDMTIRIFCDGAGVGEEELRILVFGKRQTGRVNQSDTQQAVFRPDRRTDISLSVQSNNLNFERFVFYKQHSVN